MIAEIIVKKARQDGIDGFVFVDFKNILEFDDLSSKYLGNEPCFYSYAVNSKDLYVCSDSDPDNKKIYQINEFISREDFCKLISILQLAGQRLTDINKKLKKKRSFWIGDKEIVIKI